MSEGKKAGSSVGVIELHYPTLIHWVIFILPVSLMTALISYNMPYQATAFAVTDICRTLLALNGTLLALVVGFSAFYFAVIDTRRIQATQTTEPEWFNEIKRAAAPMIVKRYKEKMRAVAILLTSVAIAYAIILCLTFVLYLYSLSLPQTDVIAQPSLWVLALNFTVLSPIVTIADPIIMTWYLTRDVAGSTNYRCPYCNQTFKDVEVYQNHLNECTKKTELKKNLETI